MLSILFASLVGTVPGSDAGAQRAYGTIQSVRGRRDALDAAAHVFFFWHKGQESVRAEYDLLMKHYSAAGPRRNDIAHAMVMDFRFDAGTLLRGAFLVPPPYATSKNSKLCGETHVAGASGFDLFTHDYRYTAADVEHFTTRFVQLMDWTQEVWERVRAIPPHPMSGQIPR